MKKSRIFYCIAAALSALLLCSCVDMELGLVINDDLSVRYYVDATIDEDIASEMDMDAGDLLDDSSSEFEDLDVMPIEKSIDGKNFIGERRYRDISYDELMSDGFGEYENEDISFIYELKNVGLKKHLVVGITLKDIETTGGGEAAEYILDGMMSMGFRLTAPFEIVSTNGSIENGSIYWNLAPYMTNNEDTAEFNAEFIVADYTLPVIIAAAAILLIAVAIVIVIIASKKKSGAAAAAENAVVNPVANAPVEAAAETPAETTAEAPVETVTEAPTETVAEAPAETVAEAPAEATEAAADTDDTAAGEEA